MKEIILRTNYLFFIVLRDDWSMKYQVKASNVVGNTTKNGTRYLNAQNCKDDLSKVLSDLVRKVDEFESLQKVFTALKGMLGSQAFDTRGKSKLDWIEHHMGILKAPGSSGEFSILHMDHGVDIDQVHRFFYSDNGQRHKVIEYNNTALAEVDDITPTNYTLTLGHKSDDHLREELGELFDSELEHYHAHVEAYNNHLLSMFKSKIPFDQQAQHRPHHEDFIIASRKLSKHQRSKHAKTLAHYFDLCDRFAHVFRGQGSGTKTPGSGKRGNPGKTDVDGADEDKTIVTAKKRQKMEIQAKSAEAKFKSLQMLTAQKQGVEDRIKEAQER
jgi:hypothetical protein